LPSCQKRHHELRSIEEGSPAAEEEALPPEAKAAVVDTVELRRTDRRRLTGIVLVLVLSTAVGPVASAATGDRQPNRSDPSELWAEFPLQPSEATATPTRRNTLTQRLRGQHARGAVSDPSDSFDWAIPLMLAAGAGLTATLWLGVAALRRDGKGPPSMRAPAVRRARARQMAGGIRYRDY
jgi:hypothetical protein